MLHPFSLPLRRTVRAGLLVVAVVVAANLVSAQEAKRPLRHTDYDSWKSIQSAVLSRNGKYLAYNLMPAEGDGEFVVRNLASSAEQRVARGRSAVASAAPAADDLDDEDQPGPRTVPGAGGRRTGGPGALAGVPHQFTPDSKFVIFPLPPTKAALDKAKAKKKPEEIPATVVAVMDLASGKITARLEHVTGFSVVGDGAGMLIYKREAKPEDKAAPPKEETTPPKEGTTPPAPGRGPQTTPQRATDLVIRNLADDFERTIPEVTEYTVTRDGKTLVYLVVSKKDEANGVYAIRSLPGGEVMSLLSGKGRYTKLIWDEKQSQLVFFSDKEDAAAAKPKFKVYHWDRTATKPLGAGGADAATDLLSLTPAGIREGWSISDRGAVTFSPDGTRLYVSTGPVRESPAPENPAPGTGTTTPPRGRGTRAGAAADGAAVDENKVVVDLWHYKDEYIQPMQKVRANQEQNKTYRAVYFLKDKAFRQLSDETAEVLPAAAGDFALGSDNRKYRHLTGYGPELSDYAIVNVRSGDRKPLLEASHWLPTFAPSGRYLLNFDGKDWNVTAVPDGKKTNLTAKLPIKFVQEEWDQPSEAPAYGNSGWSADGKYALLNDRYDIWKVAVDGSEAKCLTGGLGRKTRTVLHVVRQPRDETETRDPGVDLAKPLLLKAVNESTRDEGFYRLEPGSAEPKLLVMGARSYSLPVKAKNADTYLLTISSFYDFPDYFVTGPDFNEMRRVTNANPQKKDFVWGKAELVHYKNLDGVELSGMLIKPENFDPHKKYPMIVYIYERLSQNVHRFAAPSAGTSINPTYYASNGYLVFMPDIVYTVGAPGQSALKCVLPGIQAVVDKGCVDEKAIGIQGHSWGGYQIAYMVTQTTRFKAAAAGAPVSNMVSAYDGIRWGTGLPRQFQYERTQSRLGANLWQAPQRFIENSPIFMADRVQTPLLMLHNDQDDAVPWYQGIEYFLALRRLGKECYLFNYNGEPHGLRKKANQRDYTMRMQQFFDHHLKGAPAPEWMAKGIPYLQRDKEKEQWKTPAATTGKME
jgi:dipeptidyl aminopeptidase/acylaminoacyl peptidase